jgi:hypothetical protein
MKMGVRVPELLRKTEIDNVDLIVTPADSHEEVVRFDIPMGMNVLDMGDLV